MNGLGKKYTEEERETYEGLYHKATDEERELLDRIVGPLPRPPLPVGA